jgi:hypothetical protein
MKLRILFWILLLVAVTGVAEGQTVVVSDDSTNITGAASAVLDVKSVSKGMLVPRVTAAQKAAISSPATGLLVYQTDGTDGFYYYNGTSWTIISTGSGAASQWTTTGNDIYYNTGAVGIGINTPNAPLHVKKASPTTGSTTVGLLEGVQDAGYANGVYAQILNSSANSSKTGLKLGGATTAKQWTLGTDSAGNNGRNFYLYDGSATAARLYIDSGGRVGLGGNTAPTQVLDVTGNIKFSGAVMPGNDAGTTGFVLTSAGAGNAPTWTDPNSYITSGWQLDGSTLSSVKKFGTLSYHDIPFVTNNVEKMRLMADGKLGIGKTNPSEILDIVGNVRFSGALMPGNAAGSSGTFLMSSGTGTAPTWGEAWKPDGNTISGTKSLGTTSYTDLPLITNNVEKMRIKADGKVGIGTATPAQVLDVSGNVAFSGALMPNGSAGSSGYFLTSAGTNTPPTWTNPSTLAWAPGGNTFSGNQNFGTVSYHDVPFITANTEKMRLMADGKLGIGKTNPSEILDVVGNIRLSGAFMPNNSAGTSGFFLTSAGTNTPPTWTDPSTLAWKPGGNTFSAEQDFGTSSYHDLPFITAGSEKIRLKADGKVGIGKTAPSEILDVVGNVRFSGALMPNNAPGSSGAFLMSAGAGNSPTWADAWKPGGNTLSSAQNFGTASYHDIPFITANSEKMRLMANGRLGIGTTNPGQMLEVVGNVSFSGALMPNNSYGTSGQALVSAGMNNPPTWADVWLPGGNTIYSVQNFGTNAYTDLPFVTNSTERMRITAAGNVGINNPSPSQALDVTGNVRFSGALMPNNTAGTSGNFLKSAGSGQPPTWGAFTSGDLPSAIDATKIANGSVSNAEFQYVDGVTSAIQTQLNAKQAAGSYAASGANTDITSVNLSQTGLTVKGASANSLTIKPNETLTAGRTLNLITGNADRTLSLGGNLTTASSFTTSGANALTLTTTGATNVTLPTTGTLVNNAVTSLSSLATVGTISSGTWNGTIVSPTYGGTGVDNGSSTLTLAANFATSGANALTLTTTGATNVTLPTTGTLVNTTVTSLSSLATVGTISSGTWNGALISPTYGGTGINNGTKTITLGGNFATSGANAVTLTTTGATNVTLPTTGTLVNSAVTTLSSLSSVGTITTGTWNGTAISATNGGTGQTSWTTGDMPYASATNTVSKLPGNTTTTKKFLTQTGSGSASAAPAWNTISAEDVPGTFIGIRKLTASGTYTPTTGTNHIVIHMVGGGGGGGGVTGSNSRIGAAGGGGAGGMLIVDVNSVSGTYTYTIGTGGAGGAAGNNTGSNGGNTTFVNGGTTYTAKGGSGGQGQAQGNNVNTVEGGAGALVSTNGDINSGGSSGGPGIRLNGTQGVSGNGGNATPYGAGGDGRSVTGGTGNDATGFGGGGAGAFSTSNGSLAGGDGAPGLILIYEYR